MQEQPTLCNKATFGADVPKVVVVQKHKLILLVASFRYMTCVQEATFSMQKFWCKIIGLRLHFLCDSGTLFAKITFTFTWVSIEGCLLNSALIAFV